MIAAEKSRTSFVGLVLFLALVPASTEAFANDRVSEKLESGPWAVLGVYDGLAVDAELYARGLLHNAEREKMVQDLRKLTWKTSSARKVYYKHIMKVARAYIQTTVDGPLDSTARLLLCGTETCKPATYAFSKALSERYANVQRTLEKGDLSKAVKLSGSQPKYTKIARKAGIQGSVVVQAIINKQGDLTNVVVLEGLPMGLAENAVKTVKRWKFMPATLDGEPVEMVFRLAIGFYLG